MSSIVDSIRGALSPAGVVESSDEMAPYLTDWRGVFQGKALCVARPETVDDVSKLARIASSRNLALVPQGGNTGLAGGATPFGDRPQIVVSLCRMTRIRNVDKAGLTIAVEAGCIVQRAKEAARAAARQLPISFASDGSATVGGMISTNAGGINALRYGTARQLVLGLEVVLADGTIVSGMRSLRKDVAGYDWKQLFIGSEGTLGTITAAVLRMVPESHERCGAFIALRTPGDAVRLLEQLYDSLGECIGAFELMSSSSIEMSIRHLGGRVPVTSSLWHVLLELADSAGNLDFRLQKVLAQSLEDGLISDAAVSKSLTDLAQFWALRENMGEAMQREGRATKHDVAVGVSAVPQFLDVATSATQSLCPNLHVVAFGHVGDGNIHFNVFGSSGEEMDRLITRTVHDAVRRFEGSIAAEHGIGQYRVHELLRTKTAAECELMARIKIALDPDAIMNPGKVLPSRQVGS